MELRQLRYFVAIAESGAISGAAKALHVAQPALTKQIHGLEEDLGVPLFERSSRGVTLTAAGQQFLGDAKRLLADAASARRKAQMAGQGQIGALSIGVTVLHCWLPEIARIFSIFKTANPTVSITLSPLLSGTQVEQLREGKLDAGFLFYRPTDEAELAGLEIYRERFVLVAHKNAPIVQRKPTRLADLQDEDFIWFPRSASPSYHDHLIHCFRRAGFTPKVVQEGIDNTVVLSLVAAGMGCSVVPATVNMRSPADVVTMPLEDLDLEIPLELVWREDNTSPALLRFIAAARSLSETGSSSNGRPAKRKRTAA